MKRIILISAIASAALVGCTKNEPAQSAAEDHVIAFDTPVMSTATKAATEIADNFPTTKDFAVYAHRFTGDYTQLDDGVRYMNNVQVTHSNSPGTNGSWGSTKAYFWPKSGSLTFAAYAPYMTSGVSYDGTGIHFNKFKVEAEASNQVDLLFSERAYNQTIDDQEENNPYYYGVQISFLHALSSIQFKVAMSSELAASSANYEIVVTDIKVLNAYSQGDFNQGLTDAYNSTTKPAATGDWSNYASATDYTAYSDASGISLTDNSVEATVSGTNSTNLILLPQKMKHGSAADDSDEVKVQVTYKMRHDNMDSGIYIEDSVSASLNSSSATEWLRGKRYIYTLTIGLEEIRFSPEITDWSPEEVTGMPEL